MEDMITGTITGMIMGVIIDVISTVRGLGDELLMGVGTSNRIWRV